MIVPPPKFCTDNGAMIAQAGLERFQRNIVGTRSEEHTSELQSLTNLVCRLLLEKKKKKKQKTKTNTKKTA